MNKKEFGLFASALRTYYPKEQILPNQQAMELWFREIEDIDYYLAETALRKWVAHNKWSPSISEIREMVTIIVEGDAQSWVEAWERVRRAIRLYGIYDEKKAMESFDALTRRCVQHLGFRELCVSENPEMNRANFRMCYEIEQKRDRESKVLPSTVREAIARIQTEDIAMIGDGDNEEVS